MPENKQTDPMQNGAVTPEDEIELIDLLRVIWKWKYLIIGGTVVCALAAAIISFYTQPVYQVSMVLKSGIYKVGVDGKPVYLDSAGDFKTLIEGELLFKVLNHSNNRNNRGVASSGAYKITADNNINTLRIVYESTDREGGIENLNFLSNMLIETYENRLKYLQDNYENDILIKKRQLEFSIDEEKFITSKLNEIQKRIDSYTQEIRSLNDSSEPHSKSQISLLNYSSIIEVVTDLKRKHAEVALLTALTKKEITDLEKEKISKQAIITVQPPTASQHPIKPYTRRNVMLAAIVGFFMMVFLSFLLEYISKNKVQKPSVG